MGDSDIRPGKNGRLAAAVGARELQVLLLVDAAVDQKSY
jgi:hypothetical protein